MLPQALGACQASDPPALDEVQQRIARSLAEEGIAVADFRELFDDDAWNELTSDMAPWLERCREKAFAAGERPAKKHDFILRRFLHKGEDDPKTTFTLDDPWLRLGASTKMLDIVNTYRGELTRLQYIDNWFTVPYAAADKRIASQRWHRDPEEEHIVKVFLYFSDVDEEAGPFEYIRGSTAGARYGGFWPWSPDDRHPPEDELYEIVAPEDRLTLTGPVGTMVFCDTGGFHRGGFARTKPRILATWSYVSLSGKRHRFRVELEGREAELPAQVRSALT